jgi:hypothetical protein
MLYFHKVQNRLEADSYVLGGSWIYILSMGIGNSAFLLPDDRSQLGPCDFPQIL